MNNKDKPTKDSGNGGDGRNKVHLLRRPQSWEILVDSPANLNALSTGLAQQISDALTKIEKELKDEKSRSERRCVFLTAKTNAQGGRPIWIAGGDLKELANFDKNDARSYLKQLTNLCLQIAQLPLPVVGFLNGDAIGGGAEFFSWCDLRIMSADASILYKQSAIGLAPGYGGTVRLVDLVGLSTAQKWLFLGKRIHADDCLKSGFSHEVVPVSQPKEEIFQRFEDALSEASPEGMALQKRQFYKSIDLQSIEAHQEAFLENWKCESHRNYLSNFFSS